MPRIFQDPADFGLGKWLRENLQVCVKCKIGIEFAPSELTMDSDLVYPVWIRSLWGKCPVCNARISIECPVPVEQRFGLKEGSSS